MFSCLFVSKFARPTVQQRVEKQNEFARPEVQQRVRNDIGGYALLCMKKTFFFFSTHRGVSHPIPAYFSWLRRLYAHWCGSAKQTSGIEPLMPKEC